MPGGRLTDGHRARKNPGMHTILGAGGAIGTELARELLARGEKVRLVSRHLRGGPEAAEVRPADLTDAAGAIDAVRGSRIVYLLAGLKYSVRAWRESWPRIMGNTIEACKRAGVPLVFFDNVYMYGRVDGPMTEETPFNPCSRKGEIRARIATALLDEVKAGTLTALIARSADFYGPRVRTGIANLLVFDKLAADSKAMWLVNDHVPHSWTYVPDAARSLVELAASRKAWNQTWHVPTAPTPPTGREFISMAAQSLGVPARHTVLGKPLLRLAGLVDGTIRSSYEMLYQNQYPYVFASEKFNRTFGFTPTSYADGIRQTAAACRLPATGPS
jgi:nucleoside-diphosphate-sugar epimerase